MKIWQLILRFIELNRRNTAVRRTTAILAAITVFVTTYALILPAITLERSTTEDMPGFVLDQSEDGQDKETGTDDGQSETTDVEQGNSGIAPVRADQEKTTIQPVSRTFTQVVSGASISLTFEDAADLEEDLIMNVAEIGTEEASQAEYDQYYAATAAKVAEEMGVADTGLIDVHFYRVSFEREIPAESADNTFEPKEEKASETVIPAALEPVREIVIPTGSAIAVINRDSTEEPQTSNVAAVAFRGGTSELILGSDRVSGTTNAAEISVEDGAFDTIGVFSAPDFAAGTLTAEGADYSIAVNYPAFSGIGKDSSLSVRELAADSDEYASYYQEMEAAIKAGIVSARLFDIDILDAGGAKIQPKSQVNVAIKVDDPIIPADAEQKGEVQVVHFEETSSAEENITEEVKRNAETTTAVEETAAVSTDSIIDYSISDVLEGDDNDLYAGVISDEKHDAEAQKDNAPSQTNVVILDSVTISVNTESNGQEVCFDTDGFSVYGVAYTVDFEHELDGKVFRFSMKGGKTITLSELAEVLGMIDGKTYASVDAFLEEVQDVAFSNESLVSVTKNEAGKDWILESLQAFTSKEILLITMNDGSIIKVKVTDAQETTSPWNIGNEDNTKWLHVKTTDSSVTETEQERDVVFKLHITYSLEEDVVRAIDQYQGNPVLIYDLSNLIANSPLEIKNSVVDISIGNRKLGTCTFKDGKAVLEFTDPTYFDDRVEFTGFFDLTAQTNESELGERDEYTYEFPGTGDTVTIHYKKTVEDGTKTIYATQDAEGNYILHYTANINVNSALNSLTFNDVLGGLQTLDVDSIKINGTPVNVTKTGDGFTFDVATALGTSGVEKGSYRVTYDTKVSKTQLDAMTAEKTTETNKAAWKANGDKDVPGGETTYEIKKPVPPIPVVKTSSSTGTNQPDDEIYYMVTFGDENTDLAGFRISDRITDVVIPQGKVSISYNGQSTEVDFGNESTDSNYSKGMVPLFDYSFPEGTPGKGPVTVTYTVKLIDADTAKENGVYDTTTVLNLAQEHRQNTTDQKQTTVTYEKEPTYSVEKTASVTPSPVDGKWQPESNISYTLTIGDANTNMAGVNIHDEMTDLQTLQGDVMIRIGNGSQKKLSDYVSGSIKWTDDGTYSRNKVEIFNFNMPSDAGNGPVVITYNTKVISQEQASANNIYGETWISNIGYGGKQSDSTRGTGTFKPYPISKTVKQNNADVNGQKVEMGSTIHYTLTFGDAGMNMHDRTIYDEMTDLQKLIGDVTVTKADGTSFTMPVGSGMWAEDGVVWNYFDDGKYSTGNVRVFNYKLPRDIGNGPITVEYDVQIISEEEANESGIEDTQHLGNKFEISNHQAQTTVDVDFPKDPKHEAEVSKEFNDNWDINNNTLYWDIIVEKTSDSAYPIENVEVREFWDESGIVIKNAKIGIYYYKVDSANDFDLVNAVVTTDSGTTLTPGIDYNIDKSRGAFIFPVLSERVHINLPFHSPVQISDGFTMHNVVRLNNNERGEADATYTNSDIEIIKNGTYTESSRIIEWEVQLNPSAVAFEDSNPLKIMFTDALPEGLTLLNATQNHGENNPSLEVSFPGKGYTHIVPASVNENNVIVPVDIAAHGAWGDQEFGLNGNKIVIRYWTKISDDEWNRITSSESGTKTYDNTATVTAGDGKEFTTSDKVTVTVNEYIHKYDTTLESGGVVVDGNDIDKTSKNITYKIDINPLGRVLNSGNVLTLTDYISTNMDLDTGSVKLYMASSMGQDGKLIHGTEESKVGAVISYNDDSRLLAIRNIPDETPMVLEYVCVARAQGEDTFTNTATLIGGGSHSSSTSETHNVQTNDAGVKVDSVIMSLHKIDENEISKDLANAKFQLYECILAIGDLTNSDTYNTDWWNELLQKVNKRTAGNATEEEIKFIDDNFKIVKMEPVFNPVVTGDKGFTQWSGLSEHKLYAWKEIEAPEQYTGTEDFHYFVAYQHINVNSDELPQPLLTEAEQLNRKHAAWALDDATQFANGIRVASMSNLTTWTVTNIHHPYTAISTEKVWQGDSNNLYDTRPKDGIKVQLVRIDENGNKVDIGDKVSINVDDNGNWPGYIWNQLELGECDQDGNLIYDEQGNIAHPYKYTVVEDRVEGYATTYSDSGNGQKSGTITITNKMIPKSTNIHVQKVFSGFGNDEELPKEIHVTLLKIRTDKDGNDSEPLETGKSVMLTAPDWKYTFEKLDTKEVENGVSYTLRYTVAEDVKALQDAGFQCSVSYSDHGEGVLETTPDKPLTITNQKQVSAVKVTKTFVGLEQDHYPEQFQISATWKEEAKTKTLTLGNSQKENVTRTGSGTLEDPYEWTIANIPAGTEVTFTESGYDVDGYEVTVTGSATTGTKTTATATANIEPGIASFVNTYQPTTESLEVTKIWQDNNDKMPWPEGKEIQLILHKEKEESRQEFHYAVKEEMSEGVAKIFARSENENAPTATVSDVNGYVIGFKNLETGYHYYVTEEDVAGYSSPEYWYLNGENLTQKTGDAKGYAEDKEYIINRLEDSYTLPSTGGPGTRFFMILGSVLILAAGALLLRKRRMLKGGDGLL